MKGKRYLLIAAGAIVMAMAFPSPAAAGGGGQGGSNGDGTGFVMSWAGGRDFTPGGHSSGCTYDVPSADFGLIDDLLNNMVDASTVRGLGTELDSEGRHFWTGEFENVLHHYSYRECPDGSGGYTWLPVVTGPNLGRWAYEALIRKVPQPDPYFDPIDASGQWLYTQVPTDYRLRDRNSYFAEASAFGATVRATATPREVVFDLTDVGRVVDSDGDQVTEVTCPALGSIAPYDASNPGACSVTFLDSSSISGDSDFDYIIRVEYDVVYTGVGAGPLPPPTTITTFTTGESVRVGEARPST